MNIIQQQAAYFYKYEFDEDKSYEDFIQSVRLQLHEYRKEPHKLEFVDHLMTLLKKDYDKHLTTCSYPKEKGTCPTNFKYENCLFFIQNERDEIIENLQGIEFTMPERNDINESLQKIIADLELIKMGQELTYDDLVDELNELKEFYFLNKKNWSQMLIGKLLEMVASGVISEATSKAIVATISENYKGLIQ
jgi:hypothetical protein